MNIFRAVKVLRRQTISMGAPRLQHPILVLFTICTSCHVHTHTFAFLIAFLPFAFFNVHKQSYVSG